MAKQIISIAQIIKSTPPFCDCTSETLDILTASPQVCYNTGDIIHSPDSTQKKLIIMLSGKAEVYSDRSQKTLLRILNAGDSVGIANLYSECRFVSIITAKRPCTALEIDKSTLDGIIIHDSAVMQGLLTLLSDKICYLNRKIQYYTAGSVECRLATYLYNSSTEDMCELTLSAVSLSEMLSVGRASLYRALDRLESDGFITRQGKTIYVKDREKMLSAYTR